MQVVRGCPMKFRVLGSLLESVALGSTKCVLRPSGRTAFTAQSHAIERYIRRARATVLTLFIVAYT